MLGIIKMILLKKIIRIKVIWPGVSVLTPISIIIKKIAIKNLRRICLIIYIKMKVK